MATDKNLELDHGDITRVFKLTRLLKMGPQGKGFSYQYVKEVLDEENVRQNADIRAIAERIVADRKRSVAALIEVRAKKRRPKTITNHPRK